MVKAEDVLRRERVAMRAAEVFMLDAVVLCV